ncbi:hypothetical protein QEH59_17395 [Coraliomargarita sp. SDUM461004]|uniref:Alpha/beta hydrolase n=1 Tax=Thalassobacterium sedimentorum TaxID=3041258 RepID=A0ABU1AN40_9BACT|nr:hypothetical protein [Coraliomargarita sp. SDUM461004]MDQ8196213.1 hypothetical protein [Coraliomargarita sp. SDUM461004]
MFLLLIGSVVQTFAEDVYDWHARDARGDEVAVLVLCPGMNSDGAHFLSEEPWVTFAEDHGLGIIAVNFSSDPERMYGVEQAGYYWPEQGSGTALLDAIDSTYGRDLPILIYGFSGGAHFTSRFVEWVPERVLTWAAYSAQFWDDPLASETSPPGIVACGELDSARWFPSFSYFYKGRELGKPWTWVSIAETGHHRKGAFETFVRAYFSQIMNSNFVTSEPFVDVDTEQVQTADDSSFQPGLLSWLPNSDLLPQWQKLHHQ